MDNFTIEFIMLITAGSGILAYLLGKFHAQIGAIVTIVGSLFTFGMLAYLGYTEQLNGSVDYLPYVTFQISYLGTFFAIVVSFVFAMVSFFNPYFIEKYENKAVYSLLYMLSLTGVIGVFFTNNFLTLFFFFEFVVWTSLFLIPIGKGKKASVTYFGFSAFGGFALLFAILIMHQVAGTWHIDSALNAIQGNSLQVLVYILLAIAAFSKLGAFPLHVWLPEVLRDTPDPITAVFSGGLEKLGAFVGVLLFLKVGQVGNVLPILNQTVLQGFVTVLAAITIVVGTLMAIREDDAKKLLAYSSMSNGGYILLALNLGGSIAFSGGMYHILAHALATAAAFLAIAAVSRQTNTTKISELGGMIHKMPISYMVYLIAIISMAGIPPMGGFISKWLIFQTVLNRGMIFVTVAVFFGSIGSFLYVFRPLAALFLGQELKRYEGKIKEAPFFMLVPMIILSLLNVYTGVLPGEILGFINQIGTEVGLAGVDLAGNAITGYNGVLQPVYISVAFAVGVGVAFIIFILLPKSRKIPLTDTYTAANFVHNQDLLHYSVDFYAPLERLYAKYTKIMQNFYSSLANKVQEIGRFFKYFYFTHKPEITVFWIMAVIAFLLWGDIV